MHTQLVLLELSLVVNRLDRLEEIYLVLEVWVGLELFKFFGTVLCGDVEEFVGEVFVDLSEFFDGE